MPEFRSSWEDADDLVDYVRGSCQIPLVDGSFFHASARGGGLYVDGELSISSRAMRAHLGGPAAGVVVVDSADIRPSVRFPRRWSYVYPDEAAMRAMYADGYAQAARFFKQGVPGDGMPINKH